MRLRLDRHWQYDRANTKEIGRALRHLGIPGKDVSDAIPFLFRSIVEYKKNRRRYIFLQLPLVLVFEAPYLLLFAYGSPSENLGIFDLLTGPDVLTIASLSLVALFSLFLLFMPNRKYVVEGRLLRAEKLSRRGSYSAMREALVRPLAPFLGREVNPPGQYESRIVGAIGLALFGGSLIFLTFQVDPSKLWYAGADTILLALYFVALAYLLIRVSRMFYQWLLPPDVALVRALLAAFTLTYAGTISEWKSFGRRRRIALRLCEAAAVLEGPMQRIFSSAHDGKACSNLRAIAAGLREKLDWLATPRADTRSHLALAIGKALVVAVVGDLDRLVGPEAATTILHLGWQDRVVAFVRWAFVALGPAFAVFVGWKFVNDNAVRTLAVQFAAVCFLSATFSATGQGGDDRLSNVMKIGGGLFGWGRRRD